MKPARVQLSKVDPNSETTLKRNSGESILESKLPLIQANAQKRAKDKEQRARYNQIQADKLKRINSILDCVPNEDHFDSEGDNIWQVEREELEESKRSALIRLENYRPPKANMVGMISAKLVLMSLENGASIMSACKAANITVPRFHALYEADRDFKDAVDMIRDSMAYAVEDALFHAATNPEIYGSVTAAIYISKNRMPDRYNDKPSPRAKQRTQLSDDELAAKIDRLQSSVDGVKRKQPTIDAEYTVESDRTSTNDSPESGVAILQVHS